eukprot:1273638-Alexandrium_andersonii.AAC.1
MLSRSLLTEEGRLQLRVKLAMKKHERAAAAREYQRQEMERLQKEAEAAALKYQQMVDLSNNEVNSLENHGGVLLVPTSDPEYKKEVAAGKYWLSGPGSAKPHRSPKKRGPRGTVAVAVEGQG